MQTGWKRDSQGWCFLLSNGKASQNQWISCDEDWYYINNDYHMVTNIWKRDSQGWCYLLNDGKATKNQWVSWNGDWYYIKNDWHMASNLLQRDSQGWCYLLNDGKAAKNQWVSWNGDWYFIKNDYHAATNIWQKDSQGWCYLLNDGKAAKNQWISWAGNWYYIKNDCHMATNTWQKDSMGWCYLLSNGIAAKNQWISWNGNWYYFGSDCRMIANTSANIDGRVYRFDAAGRWISPLQQAMEKTTISKNASQIVLVVDHNLTFWSKDSDDLWVKRMDVYCGYGANGFVSGANRSEGSKTTPTGTYPITLAFGTGPNPGTSMTYRIITSNSYWSSANDRTYNTWVESQKPIPGEHLINYSVYKYALAIGYNTNPVVYGKGSAIFLHCKNKNNWATAGCISLEEKNMLTLMRSLKKGSFIIIAPNVTSIASS